MNMPDMWNRFVVYGWFAFFGVFMGLDFLVWLTRNPHIPTFSRVVCGTLPKWLVLTLTAVLLLHFWDTYRSLGK
jgi:hypothetical protein